MENIIAEKKELTEIEKTWKIEKEELKEELKDILMDYFRADIMMTKEGLDLNFFNGQKILLRVEE